MLIKSIPSTKNIQPAFGTHLINVEPAKGVFERLASDEFKKGFEQAREELEKDGDNDAALEFSLSDLFSFAVYKKKESGINLLLNSKKIESLNKEGKAGDVKEFLIDLCKIAKSEFKKFISQKGDNPTKTDKN